MTEYNDFNHIEDPKLRAKNRGTTMANIFQDHEGENQNLSQKGASVLFKYFNDIPATEKALAYACFQEAMADRGYVQMTKH